MQKNTSVIIGDHFDQFIASQVKKGRYSNASEVMRAGLRMLEDYEQKLESLRAALIEGEKSGMVENFSMQSVIDELDRKSQK